MRGLICDPTSGALGGGGGAALPAGSAQGQILYWNEALGDWAISAAPADGQLFRYNSGTGAVEPVTPWGQYVHVYSCSAILNGTSFVPSRDGNGNAVTTDSAGGYIAAGGERIVRAVLRHNSPVAADPLVYTMIVNGVDTAVVLNLSSGAPGPVAASTNITLAANDLVTWRVDGATAGRVIGLTIQTRLAIPLLFT